MKRLYSILFIALCLLSAKAGVLPTNSITGHIGIVWTVYTNSSTLLATDAWYNIYECPSLGQGVPFRFLTNVSITNFYPLQGYFDGGSGNYVFTNFMVPLSVTATQHYFFVTASNFWGEGVFSDPAYTPPPPPYVGNTVKGLKLP